VSDARIEGGRGGLERLRVLLREGGGLMASLVASAVRVEADPVAGPGVDRAAVAGAAPADAPTSAIARGDGHASPALLAAEGPRTLAQREEYELLVEAIYEGYLLHYGEPRVVHVPEADLRLLAGDQLYAIGLARLVELGDTVAVAELADTITLSALAQGGGEAELADAIWTAGARAVGWGASEAHGRVKDLVFAGDPTAIEAMRTIACAVPAPP